MSDKEIKLIENQSYEPRQPKPDLYIEELLEFIAINQSRVDSICLIINVMLQKYPKFLFV